MRTRSWKQLRHGPHGEDLDAKKGREETRAQGWAAPDRPRDGCCLSLQNSLRDPSLVTEAGTAAESAAAETCSTEKMRAP